MSGTDSAIDLQCRIGAWGSFATTAVTLDDIVLGVGVAVVTGGADLRQKLVAKVVFKKTIPSHFEVLG